MEYKDGKIIFDASVYLILIIFLPEMLPLVLLLLLCFSESLSLAPVVHSSNLLLVYPLWALFPFLIHFLQNK